MSEGGRFGSAEGDNLQSCSATQAEIRAALHFEISTGSCANPPAGPCQSRKPSTPRTWVETQPPARANFLSQTHCV